MPNIMRMLSGGPTPFPSKGPELKSLETGASESVSTFVDIELGPSSLGESSRTCPPTYGTERRTPVTVEERSDTDSHGSSAGPHHVLEWHIAEVAVGRGGKRKVILRDHGEWDL
jgi:hypothetical protein